MDTPSTGIDSLTARFTPGRPAVVCYVPLGDPSVPAVELLDAYADAGVDVLEIGVPTADPWLDGPEVTESMARALAAGTDPRTSARVLAAWRRGRVAAGAAVPIILWFGYPELALETVRTAAWEGAIDALLLIDPGATRRARRSTPRCGSWASPGVPSCPGSRDPRTPHGHRPRQAMSWSRHDQG